jgi:hypothetical protein
MNGRSRERKKVFKNPKEIIRIIAGVASRVSCSILIRKFGILMLAHDYIFCLLPFVVENLGKFSKKCRCTLYKHETYIVPSHAKC